MHSSQRADPSLQASVILDIDPVEAQLSNLTRPESFLRGYLDQTSRTTMDGCNILRHKGLTTRPCLGPDQAGPDVIERQILLLPLQEHMRCRRYLQTCRYVDGVLPECSCHVQAASTVQLLHFMPCLMKQHRELSKRPPCHLLC